jgi:hypothetical protein
MADPITAGLIIGTTVASSAMAGVAQSQQDTAQSKAAQYNATALVNAGDAASNSAASNEGASLRRSAGQLGEQAAAIGQSGTGTGGTAQGVMTQSATSAKMDALNIWYGGELERHQDLEAANLQRYYSEAYKRNASTDLISGGTSAGTKLLMGGAGAYYNKLNIGSYGNPYSSLGGGGTF